MLRRAAGADLWGRAALGFGVLALVSCGGRSTELVESREAPPVENQEPPRPSDAADLCSEDVGVEVDVGGAKRDFVSSRGGESIFRDGCFSIFFDGYEALLHGVGSGPFDESGELEPVSGWLLLKGEGGEPRWMCSDDWAVSVVAQRPDAPLRTRVLMAGTDLRDFGTCPGTPVPGTVRWHWQGGGVPTSSVPGIAFTAETRATTLGRPPQAAAEQTESCGVVYVRWDEAQPGGFVLTSPSDPDPEALYCIGRVTLLQNSELEFGEVSRVGRCSEGQAVTGSVTACY